MRVRHKHYEARKPVDLYRRCSARHHKSRGDKRESQGSSTIRRTTHSCWHLISPLYPTTYPTQIHTLPPCLGYCKKPKKGFIAPYFPCPLTNTVMMAPRTSERQSFGVTVYWAYTLGSALCQVYLCFSCQKISRSPMVNCRQGS